MRYLSLSCHKIFYLKLEVNVQQSSATQPEKSVFTKKVFYGMITVQDTLHDI
jgi:hypothetical protein